MTAGAVFLVVDDDEGARQILVDYLRSFGYQNILEAKNGAVALEILRKQKVDFVLSDWEMPDVTGLDLLRTLKTEAAYKHIPFIMVTSPISQERYKVEDAALSKVDGYIIKPFRSDVLREKIDHVLSLKHFNGRRAVLVVDDDPQVRATIVEYLDSMGYKPIYEAGDGEEGFALLKQKASEIALVVSDWEMPKSEGIDLLRKIREDETVGNTPFIMVTSQTSIERVKIKRAIEADVDNYLLKPFKVDDLRRKVDEVLNIAKNQVGVDRAMARGKEYLEHGRWLDAIKTYNQIIVKDPSNTKAHLGLATATRHLAPEKAIPNATQFIRKAISINPQCEQAYIDLALIFESAMSLERAISSLRDALKYCAFSSEIHFHLGRMLLRRGNRSEAILELQKALDLNPENKEAKDLLNGVPNE